ncbi:MAG: DUF1223 domain-containing protein [Lysobacterales bacterium]
MRSLLFALPLALLATAVNATCIADSAAERPHLVELYTSEGCSSCPPAERWLSTLRSSTNFVALEFHVDYFNDQGWRDPYSDARYTARQKALAKHGTRDQVYTPQVVVDGHPWKTWPKGAPPALTEAPAPAVKLEVTPGSDLQIALSTPAGTPDDYRFFVALSQDGIHSAVGAGENRGKRLDHDQVVRDYAGPLALPQASATLHLPRDFDAANSAVVAFLQDQRNGDIAQVVRLPLKECHPSSHT